MKIATKEVEIQGEKLVLTNQRVIFWEKESALILSDLHVGKTAHFRKNGIAIPNQIFEKDLQRLSFLIENFSAQKVVVNGDLLHAGDNSDVENFCNWKGNIEAEFHLVQGNHDRISDSLKEKLALNSIVAKMEFDAFSFVHEFDENDPKFQITGHVHPGIILKTPVKNFRLPCFAVSERQLLMPAFSEFTGLDTKNLPEKSEIFAFSENEIYRI